MDVTPLLLKWINKKYLNKKIINSLYSSFSSTQPFPNLELPKFFQEEKLLQVLQALGEETFILKEADLFQFSQTADLVGARKTGFFCTEGQTCPSCAKNSVLQEFRSFLSSLEFVSYLSTLTGITLQPQKIDLSGTIYQDTDYLLCHDDQLEGRKIAYIIYLSDLLLKEGGGLVLYNSQKGIPTTKAKTIVPKFNTLAFFEVSPRSFHSVEEVVSDTQRIALTGWFY